MLGPQLPQALELAERLPHDVVLLTYAGGPRGAEVYPVTARALEGADQVRAGTAWPNASSGTMAYLVTVEAARLMGRYRRRPSWVADDFVYWRDQGLSVARFAPAVAWHLPERFPSTIATPERRRSDASQISATMRHQEFRLAQPETPAALRRRETWFALEALRCRLSLPCRTHQLTRRITRKVDNWATLRPWMPRLRGRRPAHRG